MCYLRHVPVSCCLALLLCSPAFDGPYLSPLRAVLISHPCACSLSLTLRAVSISHPCARSLSLTPARGLYLSPLRAVLISHPCPPLSLTPARSPNLPPLGAVPISHPCARSLSLTPARAPCVSPLRAVGIPPRADVVLGRRGLEQPLGDSAHDRHVDLRSRQWRVLLCSQVLPIPDPCAWFLFLSTARGPYS